MLPTRILVVFLDGVGLGADDPQVNPLAAHPLPFLTDLLDGRKPVRANGGYQGRQAALLGLDATLGVAGLPQSATGQTSILTGLNAPQHLAEHYGPYPNTALKALLTEHNLFSRLLAGGRPAAYAGAYPDPFHERLRRGSERLSANTRAALTAGLKLRGPQDLQAGRAISGMLINSHWQRWGYDVPHLTAAQAGAQLVGLARDHALTYFEFWQTDVVGHKQHAGRAEQLLTMIDDFFAGIVAAFDPADTLLLVISDHGNLEDLSTRRHTTNPALAIAAGAGQAEAAARLRRLTDITPFILDLLLASTPPPLSPYEEEEAGG